ncbi:MAG TPA: hypothetical protein VFR76_10020, partial [Verrucomicrobiae bacterium]|nr:hypothetical protein [Verrucomicrobiae bacterium]
QQQIGLLTYHKCPKENWPLEEFSEQSVRLPTGEVVQRPLAERGTQLSNGLWMREVRVRSSDSSQVSILSNHRGLNLTQIAVWTSRWRASWDRIASLRFLRLRHPHRLNRQRCFRRSCADTIRKSERAGVSATREANASSQAGIAWPMLGQFFGFGQLYRVALSLVIGCGMP